MRATSKWVALGLVSVVVAFGVLMVLLPSQQRVAVELPDAEMRAKYREVLNAEGIPFYEETDYLGRYWIVPQVKSVEELDVHTRAFEQWQQARVAASNANTAPR